MASDRAGTHTSGSAADPKHDPGDLRFLAEGCECERQGRGDYGECLFDDPCPAEAGQVKLLWAELVGVREQLRQAEQKVEAGARQKPREEGESDGLSGALETDRELRREWWLNHGHEFAALYGDDGEMQCGECRVDFKRGPLDDVRAAVRKARLERAAAFWAGTPTGGSAASTDEERAADVEANAWLDERRSA